MIYLFGMFVCEVPGSILSCVCVCVHIQGNLFDPMVMIELTLAFDLPDCP